MSDLFEDVELATPSNTETGVVDVVQEDRPKTTDPEWNDYVLSLFDKTEMYDGRPLCHGLRRVAELLFGNIMVSRPVKVFPPQDDNGVGRATVIWEVVFETQTTHFAPLILLRQQRGQRVAPSEKRLDCEWWQQKRLPKRTPQRLLRVLVKLARYKAHKENINQQVE